MMLKINLLDKAKINQTSKWTRLDIFLLVVGIMLAGLAEAASVYRCSDNGERCVVRIEDGKVGDSVRYLDEKGQPVAVGRIIKLRGEYAVASVLKSKQVVRKGYPVIVNKSSRSSTIQWAASFSNHE